MGYSTQDTENTAAVVVTLNGNTVYTGTVPTKDLSQFDRLASAQQVLFTLEIPSSTTSVPMSITCTSGDSVEVSAIHVNFPGNDDDPTVFRPANFEVDARQNVAIDGVAQTRGPNAEPYLAAGGWTYNIPNGSVLTHDLVLLPTMA
jgi:hypothetical protein